MKCIAGGSFQQKINNFLWNKTVVSLCGIWVAMSTVLTRCIPTLLCSTLIDPLSRLKWKCLSFACANSNIVNVCLIYGFKLNSTWHHTLNLLGKKDLLFSMMAFTMSVLSQNELFICLSILPPIKMEVLLHKLCISSPQPLPIDRFRVFLV